MHHEQQSLILEESTEPGVIDRDMLIALVIEQGPKGEAGKLFLKDTIDLNDITEIRIEFFNILHIDYLWIMPNLVKLSLSKNIIEEIENLTELVNLKELDLSFNRIRIMENLNHLTKLEILILYSNNISTVEGIDDLKALTIFNIGKNRITNWEHINYLRKFKKLRCLNTSENPCTDVEGYYSYVFAFLPHLIYYQYQMIRKEDREEAIQKYRRELNILEHNEMDEEKKLDAQRILEEPVALLSKSYVEYLDEDSLFQQMFLNDAEGIGLAEVNEDTQSAYEEYKNKFVAVCRELYQLGLEEQKRRESELKDFNDVVNKRKKSVQCKARSIVDKALEQKEKIFGEITKCVTEISREIEADISDEMMEKVHLLSEEFHDVITQTWTKLMAKEVALHEQMEDINEVLKINLTDMVNTFLETAKGHFTQLRDAETEYNDCINQFVLYYMSDFGDEKKMPEHLLALCSDKDVLQSSLAASHDIHLEVIDGREDLMLTRLKSWLEKYIENLLREENERNRQQILEISHFMKYLREEFNYLQLSYQLQLDDADPDVMAALTEQN